MTNSPPTIIPADLEYAPQIAEIIRDSIPREWRDRIIFGCPGIARFIAERIALQNDNGDVYYTVAVSGMQIIACAEMLKSCDSLFLNYIAVRPSLRSKGVGAALLRNALDTGHTTRTNKIALDVFADNLEAQRWYERLGFEPLKCTIWWDIPLASNQLSPIIVRDYPQAQCCQREYGFSKFNVFAQDRRFEVGRIGDDWYRVTDSTALAVPGFAAGLKRLDPQRRLLLLADSNYENPTMPESTELGRSLRLAAPIDVVRRRLDERLNCRGD